MSESSRSGSSARIAVSTPVKSSVLVTHQKAVNKSFASPSFLSPTPACTSHKVQNKLTLSGQPTRKTKPITTKALGVSTQLKAKILSHKNEKTRVKAARVLEDISNKAAGSGSGSHDPMRKLEFCTPIKTQPEPIASSSSSSSSSEDEGYCSEEAEVVFDAATIGNMRIVRESPAPNLALSSTSSSSVGLEFYFPVSSTVSSVAVSPNGKFLVVGFYNGMVYLYPLTQDSLFFRRGVLLDQIMPRGMYTQIMVTVSIPEDGKFIFAGVYRGSTDIRAYEVDSITLPSPTDPPQTSRAMSSSLLTTGDSDASDEDEDNVGVFGLPMAKVVSHTYSDAKLKGFAAAKSLCQKKNKKMEYRLLCGIGIKTVHMWRFYQKKTSAGMEWSWECVFDKQTNGISLEFISFHPTIANQFISKSEHQNVRIWHLEEDYDASDDSVTICKKSHTDVKHTVDTVAVYGDYAYGGSESLAVIDLQAATRMDLDLPLSAKEQRAQYEAAINSRNANSLRAWNPRGNRRRGAEDTSAQRHMRTVSKIAGQDASPFTVGMCSDGSVFFHQPKKDIGIATPLDYIEGYEQFFVDPSLDFQAQFSDLTRVNTSGLLAVLPLPETEKERWIVVAANQDHILVRSLEAFLHCSQQKKKCSLVNSNVSSVMRNLGRAESSSGQSSSDSDVDDEREKLKHPKQHDKTVLKRGRQHSTSKSQEAGHKVKRSRYDNGKAICQSLISTQSGEKKTTSSFSKIGSLKKSKPKQLDVANDQNKVSDNMTAVTTPKRDTDSSGCKLSTSTASPVVSISSSSGSSNPNTPEQLGLSRMERQVLALKEVVWTPPHAVAAKLRRNSRQKVTNSAVDAMTVLTRLSSSSTQVKTKANDASSRSKTSHRMKAQALFTDNDDTQDSAKKENSTMERKENTELASSVATAFNKRGCVESNKSIRAQTETQDAESNEPEKASEGNQMEPVPAAEEEDVDLDEELEQLEQYEPEFETAPFVSDKGSLLAATMYQYSNPAITSTVDTNLASADKDIETDHAVATTEQTNLLMQFSYQNERLKMNFLAERERIYKHLDCSCTAHVHSKKPSTSTSGMNWRRNVAHNYLKRKQLKRRHKKQLAAKLHQLHTSYTQQMQELYAMQQLQANAFRARQQFQHLHHQFCRHGRNIDGVAPSSPTTVAPSLKHSTMPDHLSDASFPFYFPELVSQCDMY